MVYFTCNRCGSSLKKNQVANHQGCRPLSVSCLDCFKDFTQESYVAHTKCISETEKYSGKNFVPSQSFNKGEKKQAAWTENIRAILNSNITLDSEERKVFELIINHDNIPRKKAKFQNFLKNIHRQISLNTMEKVWSKIEGQLKPKTTDNPQQNNSLNNSNLNDTQKTNELDISKQNEETNKDENIEEEKEEESKKLTKKEKKEKRKRAKYESELKEIESKENENVEEELEEPKKKKKKGLKGQEAEENQPTEQVDGKKSKKNKKNKIEEVEVQEETQETKVKKSKKRKLEIDEEDESIKKKSNGISNGDYINQNEIEDNESVKPGKFPWTDKIMEILQSSKEHEISIKRLRKKISNEYTLLTGKELSSFKKCC